MKRIIEIPSPSISLLIWTLSLFAILIIFTSITSHQSVEAKYVFSNKWGTPGSGSGQFNAPEGIAADSSGRVYVTDTGNNRIQMFRLANPCPSGTTQIVAGVCFVRGWGTLGTVNGQFNKPTDVSLDASGRVYVADSGNKRIQMFKANGDFIRAWNTEGPGMTQFGAIVGIAVDTSTNEIYAADSRIQGQGVVHKFRLSNTCPIGTTMVISGVCFVNKWTYGDAPQDPPDPDHSLLGIGVNSVTHDVYASFYEEHRMPGDGSKDRYNIIRRGGEGTSLADWGGLVSNADGRFLRPAGIAIDHSGFVHVADSGNHRIQVFQQAISCPPGTIQVKLTVCLVTKWGSAGSADGQFNLPTDIDIGGPSNRVYVTDTNNHRIQEFYWKTDVGGPGGDGTSPNIAVK